jgi:hypothetical protein
MELVQQSAKFKVRILSGTTRIEESIPEGAERAECYKQPRPVCKMGEVTETT